METKIANTVKNHNNQETIWNQNSKQTGTSWTESIGIKKKKV